MEQLNLTVLFITVLVLIFFVFFLIFFFRPYIINPHRKIIKKPQRLTKHDKVLTEWDVDRAIIERKIFIAETLLKFLPASILTIFVSIFYVANQNLTFWNVHLLYILSVIILGLFFIMGYLFIKTNNWYEILYPIIREIDILKQLASDERIKIIKETAEKSIQMSEQRRLNEEIARKEAEQKLKWLKEEPKLIINLKRIINGLESNEAVIRMSASQEFKHLCKNKAIHFTDNYSIINKIDDIFGMMIQSWDKGTTLSNLIDGFHYLTLKIEKRTYYDMIKKSYYDKIKQFIINEPRVDYGYINNLHHIFCNIANKDDIELILKSFQSIGAGNQSYREYFYHTINSLIVYHHKQAMLKIVLDIIKDGKWKNIKHYQALQTQIIQKSKKSIINSELIPRFLIKELEVKA